jgi:hypothetical protein
VAGINSTSAIHTDKGPLDVLSRYNHRPIFEPIHNNWVRSGPGMLRRSTPLEHHRLTLLNLYISHPQSKEAQVHERLTSFLLTTFPSTQVLRTLPSYFSSVLDTHLQWLVPCLLSFRRAGLDLQVVAKISTISCFCLEDDLSRT